MGKIMQLFCSFFLSRQFHAQFSAFNIFYTKHMEEFFYVFHGGIWRLVRK